MAVNWAVSKKSSADSEHLSSAMKRIPARVVLLKNCITPYLLPVLRHVAASVEGFRMLVSTPMEPDRPWEPVWDGIDVTVQRSVAIKHRRVAKQGFAVTSFVHFPYDSLALLYQFRPDVIVSGELGFRTIQAFAYRRLNPSSRLVIWADLSEHTEREIGRTRTVMRRVLLRAADAVLVNGASGARYVQRLGVPQKRIVLAPYAIEMSAFISIPLTRAICMARRLLYVGRLVEGKGLQVFLRALVRWAETHPGQSCEMWFVGDGPMRKYLEQFAVPPSVNLRFFGNVPQHHLFQFYAQAGIFVFPTLSDTWGLVVNEAMAAGLPVLGSLYSQAVEDLVQWGVTGWTFFPDRPDNLQNALDCALSAPMPVLARMQEAARQDIYHLTPKYSASRFLEAIQIALDQNE